MCQSTDTQPMDVYRRLHVGQILESGSLFSSVTCFATKEARAMSSNVLLEVLEVDNLLVKLLQRRDLTPDVHLDALHDVPE